MSGRWPTSGAGRASRADPESAGSVGFPARDPAGSEGGASTYARSGAVMQYAGWRLGRAASINSGVNRCKLRPSWSLYPNDNGDGATTQAALQMNSSARFTEACHPVSQPRSSPLRRSERAMERAMAPFWSYHSRPPSRQTRCAATGFASGSPGARTPNLRIKSLPDHTAENRISSDCNGFRPAQTLPEPLRPVKNGPPP
jgi:hypothetical protein